jgi:hypothetical protein
VRQIEMRAFEKVQGMVKANHAARPPNRPLPRRMPREKPTWLEAGPGRKLTERNHVGIGRLVQPFASDDQFIAEIVEMGDVGPPKDVKPSFRKR